MTRSPVRAVLVAALAAVASSTGCALFLPAERLLLDCQREPIPVEIRRDLVAGPRRLFVHVTLDGEPAFFIVDTGAVHTGILHRIDADYVVRGAARIRLGCGSARVDSARGMLDVDPDGRDAAGLLGADGVLDGPTLLDLRDGKLVRNARSVETDRWVRIAMEQSRNVPVVTVTIDGQPRRLILDTGAPDTVLFLPPPDRAKQHRSHSDILRRRFDTRSTYVSLQWSPSLPPEAIRADFSDEDSGLRQIVHRLDRRAEGLLGLSALDRRRILFDADRGELRIEPDEPTIGP